MGYHGGMATPKTSKRSASSKPRRAGPRQPAARRVVKSGVIVLRNKSFFPEGLAVDVSPLDKGRASSLPKGSGRAADQLWEALLELAGTVEGLPRDLARNHDHYLHGAVKRRP